MEITEYTSLEELLIEYPEAMRVLAHHGMRSIACPAELIEPLRKVALSREMPVDKLIKELRDIVSGDSETQT